jgi:hypothetical protein
MWASVKQALRSLHALTVLFGTCFPDLVSKYASRAIMLYTSCDCVTLYILALRWTLRLYSYVYTYFFVHLHVLATVRSAAPKSDYRSVREGGQETARTTDVATNQLGGLQTQMLKGTCLLLVAYREYSQWLVFFWSHTENVLVGLSSIGRIQRIFSLACLILVAYREYSHWLVFYWSHTENILMGLSSIGRMQRIFIFWLVFYWSHTENFLLGLSSIGRIWRIFS